MAIRRMYGNEKIVKENGMSKRKGCIWFKKITLKYLLFYNKSGYKKE